jgi:hypothetical protein
LATWCFLNGKWGPVHVSDLLSRDQWTEQAEKPG